MRFSHFLGNVIGYILYFSLLGVLRIFAPRGYFRKKHMVKREGIYVAYLCRRLIAVSFLWLSLPGDYRVTDEALLAETT